MSCKIHLRTFSGEHHPRTVKYITYASANLHADCSFLIQVCGNHLGILFEDQFGDSSSFLVWDCRTGDQVLVSTRPLFALLAVDIFCNQQIHALGFKSFAFMTEDLILAAILRSDLEPTLQVLRIAAFVYPIYSVEDIPYVCELRYPNVKGAVENLLIRSEPTPTWKPSAGSGVPFYGSRKDFIFTISMRILWADTQEITVLFVPLSTLLSEVERSHGVPRRDVPWDVWGPDGTRVIRREPSEVWVCYTYGMRFIQGLRWNSGHEARVYDFNRYAARKHVKASVDAPTPWKRLAPESKPSGHSPSFYRQVFTRLPGRVANVTLEHSDDGWDACMIGEDHIVMVQVRYPTIEYVVDFVVDFFVSIVAASNLHVRLYGYVKF